MPTANSRLQDALVRHSVYLQRYGGGVSNRVVALLNRADFDIVTQIEKRLAKIEGKGLDSGPAVTKRMQALLTEVRQLNKAAYDAAGKDLDKELRKFAQYEADWMKGALSDVMPKGISVTAPGPRTVVAAAMSRPFQGRLLKEWLSGLEASKAARVRDAIRLGMVEGETIQQIVRRIRGSRAAGYADGLMEIDRRGAAALVRTAVNHVGSAAREALAEDNADILKGERWMATLDGRTTAICRARDGEVYPLGKGPKPPAHIGCRSVRVPVLNDEFGFLSEGRTRASENGPVSGGETYQSWLKRQPAAFQDDVLGDAKGALFRTGGLPLDRFVDQNGKELTLPQLQKAQPAAYHKAGLDNPIRPPRGTPQDEVAKFLASKPAQRELLEHLYRQEGLSAAGSFNTVEHIKRQEGYSSTIESLSAVRYYTGEGYRPINKRMRESGGTLQDRQFTALTAEGVDGMNRWEAPIWRAPTKTQANAEKWWDRAVPGEELDLGNQLQSFSASDGFVTSWGRTDVLLRIERPRSGAYIDPVSLNPGEHEVLLPPGLKYRVVGKSTQMVGGKPFRVIDLEIEESE